MVYLSSFHNGGELTGEAPVLACVGEQKVGGYGPGGRELNASAVRHCNFRVRVEGRREGSIGEDDSGRIRVASGQNNRWENTTDSETNVTDAVVHKEEVL